VGGSNPTEKEINYKIFVSPTGDLSFCIGIRGGWKITRGDYRVTRMKMQLPMDPWHGNGVGISYNIRYNQAYHISITELSPPQSV
jgi:hypothetical protein